jgi:hypothetical protein
MVFIMQHKVTQMRKFLRVLIPMLAVGITLILPGPAQAEGKKYRFEFFGGVSAPLDKNFEIGAPQSDFIIPGSQKFSTGGQGGARFGIDGARYWGQDYAYSYGSNASSIVTPYGQLSIRNQFHQASSNVLFYPCSLDRRHFFPYLTAGLGATFVVIDQNTVTRAITPSGAGIGPLKSETIFAFNAGAGVRFRLSERFGIRMDARDYMSRALRYGLPKSSSDPNQAVLPTGGVFHQIAGTIGVVIHF